MPTTNSAPTLTSLATLGAPPAGAEISAGVQEALNVTGDAATVVTKQGAFGFRDLDPANVHTVTIAPKAAGYLGALTATLVSESASGSLGTIGWSFTVADKAMDGLAAGQQVTQIYTISLSDGAGGIVKQDVAVTITGAEDRPVITGSLTGGISEGTGATYARSGILSFSDPDTSDLLVTSIAAQTTSLKSAAGVDITSSLSAQNIAALQQAFTMPVGALGANKGSQTWSYALADTALDFLGQNETATVTTTVQVADNQGGVSTANVVITIRGANDAPALVTGALQAATVAEASNATGSTATKSVQGSFQFADLDVTDTHTVTVLPKQAGYLGALTPVVATDSTGGLTGTVNWTYAVSDKALDVLAAGQQVQQVYTVAVNDGKGGSLKQDVVVTLVGSNDQPTITGTTAASVQEGTAASYARSGSLTLSDVDATDKLTLSTTGQSLVIKSSTGADVTAGFTAAQLAAMTQAFAIPVGDIGSNKGQVNWTYNVQDSVLDALGSGDSAVLTTNLLVDDHQGGTAATSVAITLRGANDAPVIAQDTAVVSATVADSQAPSTGAALTAKGGFNFTDLDQRDVHTVAAVAAQAGYLGTFSAALTQDGAGASPGTVGWSFSVADKALDFLGAGQQLTQTYVVTLSDGKGGATKQNVSVVLTGTEDLPTFTGSLGSTIYEPLASAAATTVYRSGSIQLADADQTDHLGVALSSASIEYRDASGAIITDLPGAQLTTAQASAIAAAQSLASKLVVTSNVAGAQGSIAWNFQSEASKLAFLSEGETVKIKVDVSVQDYDAANNPVGTAVIKPITVTLVGQNTDWQAKQHVAEILDRTVLTSPALDHDLGCQLPAAALRSYLDLGAKDGTQFYRPITVQVVQDGATFDGVDFRGSQVVVKASNVTFVNCLFDTSGSQGSVGLNIGPEYHDVTVDHCTFDGLKRAIGYPDFVSSKAMNTVLTNNVFLNAPVDGVYIESGVVAGNLFSGGGYYPGAHADAIWVGKTSSPLLIENNIFDWRPSADAGVSTNNAIRISSENGDVSDVTIRNNVLLGGNYTITVTDGATWTHTADQVGTVTNVKIVDNIIDLSQTGPIDWQNRPTDIYIDGNLNLKGFVGFGSGSVAAHADLAGLAVVGGTVANDVLFGSPGPQYLVGGEGQDIIHVGSGGSVVQGGAGRDYIYAGAGADLFVYKASRDLNDLIYNFDPTKDRIDVADIQEFQAQHLTASSWNWLGSAVFSGSAHQIRFVQNANNASLQFDFNGDALTDYRVDFDGKIAFTQDNLILEHTTESAAGLGAIWAGQGLNLTDRSLTVNASFGAMTFATVGGAVFLKDADGALAPISGLNTYTFADGVIARNDADTLVDDLYYFAANPARWTASHDAEADFYGAGAAAGLDPNAYFSTKGFSAVFGASIAPGVDPLTAYATSGWQQGQDPSARFDVSLYLLHNRDVAAAGVDPLKHYLSTGAASGRDAYAVVGNVGATGFDAEYYLLSHPEVAGSDPYAHYLSVGWKAGYNPNAYFDVGYYLAQNPNVAASGGDPLAHYMSVGWTLGLNPSPAFDVASYLAANPDVAQANTNPLLQFLQVGANEGRVAFSVGSGWSGAAPVANADSYQVAGATGATLTVAAAAGVLANDTDANADALTVGAVSHVGLLAGQTLQGSYGQLQMGFDGGFRYTVANAAGPTGSHLVDHFTYLVSDGTGGNNTGTLDIALNRAPALTAVGAIAGLNGAVSVGAAAGVLSKGVDADGDILSVASVATANGTVATGQSIQGAYGSLIVNGDGSYSYQAAPAYVGLDLADQFTVTVSDGQGGSASGDLVIHLGGPERAPTITGAAKATVTESVLASYAPGGLLTVSDPDATDVLTVAASAQTLSIKTGMGVDTTALFSADRLGAIKGAFGINGGAIGSNSGQASWFFSGSDAILDALGSNEFATLTTSVQVDDHRGGVASQDIVLTLVGANDGPVIVPDAAITNASVLETAGMTASSTVRAVQGGFAFKDADVSDRHVVGVTPKQGGYVGSLTASVATDTTGGSAGSINWVYSTPDRGIDFLAAGQQLTQVYTVTIADGKGGSTKQDVTINLIGTDDAPTITGTSSAAWYEGTATSYTKSGVLSFLDADLTDKLAVSIAGQSVVLKSAAGVDVTALLSADQIALIKNGFAMPVGELGSNKGSATWTYNISDKGLDFLGQNDAVTLTTTVQVDDKNGGLVSRDVVITMKGVNDAPTIVPGASNDAGLAGKVVQGDTYDLALVNGALVHHETGAVGFADADLTDAHGVSIRAAQTGYVGVFKATMSDGPGGGVVGWSFDVDDATMQKLIGDRVQTYSLTISDGRGGSVKQDVSIALTHEAADQFNFSALPSVPKAIDSFVGGWDSIAVSGGTFGLPTGQIASAQFVTGAAATAGDKTFVLDTSANNLFWSTVDASGQHHVTTLAHFGFVKDLHAGDFLVV